MAATWRCTPPERDGAKPKRNSVDSPGMMAAKERVSLMLEVGFGPQRTIRFAKSSLAMKERGPSGVQ